MIIELNDPYFLPHCSCDVHFALQEGEILVLTGENGLGKSTLLARLAQNFLFNSSSFVEQKPMDVFFDRKLGRLKEFFLSSGLTGFDREMFETLWNLFGLSLLENRLLSQLSGGEGQSLKLVLGLSKQAKCYLLDEPSQFLDDSRKIILRQQLERLVSKGSSLLIVEHDRSWLDKTWRELSLEVRDNQLRLRS